jgi:hypothetical protein
MELFTETDFANPGEGEFDASKTAKHNRMDAVAGLRFCGDRTAADIPGAGR